jgi:hypothetical protein
MERMSHYPSYDCQVSRDGHYDKAPETSYRPWTLMALTTDPTMALGNLVVDIVEESTRRNLDHSELYSTVVCRHLLTRTRAASTLLLLWSTRF